MACALLLLSPCTPLMFMGEEYGETRPFPFFCSFADEVLIEAVRRGRKAEFALHYTLPDEVPDPQAEETFRSAQLAWQWPEDSPQAGLRRLYAASSDRDARKQWPAFKDREQTVARCAADAKDGKLLNNLLNSLLIIERVGGRDGVLAIANCSDQSCSLPKLERGRRKLLLSTAEKRFGGPSAGRRMQPDRLLPYECKSSAP